MADVIKCLVNPVGLLNIYVRVCYRVSYFYKGSNQLHVLSITRYVFKLLKILDHCRAHIGFSTEYGWDLKALWISLVVLFCL